MGKDHEYGDVPPPGPPPSYPSQPSQVHIDAGPVPGQSSAAPRAPGSPYNEYGGFAHPAPKLSQQHLDPRAAGNPSQYGGSPAPGPYQPGYASPAPGPYGQQQSGYYGGYGQPPQGMYYGPPQGQPGPGPYGYPPQGGYYGARGPYQQDRHPDEGICAGLAGAAACCCCLDLLMF